MPSLTAGRKWSGLISWKGGTSKGVVQVLSSGLVSGGAAGAWANAGTTDMSASHRNRAVRVGMGRGPFGRRMTGRKTGGGGSGGTESTSSAVWAGHRCDDGILPVLSLQLSVVSRYKNQTSNDARSTDYAADGRTPRAQESGSRRARARGRTQNMVRIGALAQSRTSPWRRQCWQARPSSLVARHYSTCPRFARRSSRHTTRQPDVYFRRSTDFDVPDFNSQHVRPRFGSSASAYATTRFVCVSDSSDCVFRFRRGGCR